MLDVAYGWFGAFLTDCAKCGYNAKELLDSGEYILCSDGWVVSKDFY